MNATTKMRRVASDRPARFSLRGLGLFLGALVTRLLDIAGDVLARGLRFGENWLLGSKKALYGLAVTRILLGVSALGLLLSNFSTRLYSFGSGSVWNGEAAMPKSEFPKLWIFSAFHRAITNDLLYTGLYVLLIALAVAFVLGWRFRIVHPIFFVLWVSFIEANDMLGDQGDNMYRIAVLFLFFADPAARWSLDAKRRARLPQRPAGSFPAQMGTLFHNLALIVLTAQVSFVYVSGALYKAGGSPWSGGYAVYNPLMTDRFGTWPILSDLATAWGPAVTIAAWGSIIMQMSFPFMLLTRPTRIIALVGILGFHLGIALLMGLPWFSLTMIAIDSIFIRDRTWRGMSTGLRTMFTRSMRQARGAPLENV